MTASSMAASLPAALVAKQKRLRCSSPAGFIRSGVAPCQCGYCNPGTAAILRPCRTQSGSLQITFELHSLSLGWTTRPGSTRTQLVLHTPAPSSWARPGSISTAGPTLAPCRVTWMCLHLSAHCCEMRHSLKLARCLQLEQDWCRLKTAHGCAGLSCRASLSHEIALLTEADRTRTGRKQLFCRRRAGSALSTASMLSYCVFKDIPWEMIWKNLQTWSITDQRQEHIL